MSDLPKVIRGETLFRLFSERLPVEFGFSELTDGGMSFYRNNSPQTLQNRIAYFSKFHIHLHDTCWSNLAHGNHIEYVTENDRCRGAFHSQDAIQDADGLWTTTKNLVLCTTHADCLPLYCFTNDGNAVGLAHCGWRSIVKKLPIQMVEFGVKYLKYSLQSFRFYIGVGICVNCFEISNDIVHLFSPSVIHFLDGKYFADLRLFIQLQLTEIGIKDKQIYQSNLCSRCSNRFPSYRRDRENVNPAVAWIRCY